MRPKITLAVVAIISITGCQDDPVPPPAACFDLPASVEHGTAIKFDGSCTTNADSYRWDFGDDQYSTEASPEHTYTAPGNYSVKLVVERSGSKDSLVQKLEVVASVKETSCLPSYVLSPEIWPEESGDSVTFEYLGDKKLHAIRWWSHYPPPYISSLLGKVEFSYNTQGNPSSLGMFSAGGERIGTITIYYGPDDRPMRALYTSDAVDFAFFDTHFVHDGMGRLTEVQYWQGAQQYNYVRYELDAGGNTTKVFHDIGLFDGVDGEDLQRENISFLNSLVYYYSSPGIRFYLQYIALQGVYQNNVAEGHIYSTVKPGLNSIWWYGEPTEGGPALYSGFHFTGTDIIDPGTGLISTYRAANDQDKYYYNCDQ